MPERATCDHHSWSSSNPMKQCPVCLKNDETIVDQAVTIVRLEATIKRVRKVRVTCNTTQTRLRLREALDQPTTEDIT